MLLLGVGVGASVWLPTYLPYLVHRAVRLEETQRVVRRAAKKNPLEA